MNLESLLLEYEAIIRLGFFMLAFIVVASWEIWMPRRELLISKSRRWLNNLALVVLNTIILRLLFPTAAVGVALFTNDQTWGLFNYFVVSKPLAIILSIVILDLVIYLQHVMFHAVPLLWRLHRVHHTDLDYDVTTGSRFHPIEIILSMLIKFAVILILGPPVVAVIIFEVVLNAMAMFNHGNIRLPKKADQLLRFIIVTPDMHRVHHSIEADETNSNFGFNLSCWDRVFGTYKQQPRLGHQDMVIGISTFRNEDECTGLKALLLIPFIGGANDYVINRRWRSKDK